MARLAVVLATAVIFDLAVGKPSVQENGKDDWVVVDVEQIGRLTLFAGNDGKGSLVCDLSWNAYGTEFGITEYNWNFKKFDECENDEARSAVIQNGVKGTIISLFDSPSGSKDDDFTIIKIKKDITEPLRIDTFEKSFVNDFVEVQFGMDDSFFANGIDGKVSLLNVNIADIGVDGGWSGWSDWDQCSATCEEGGVQQPRTEIWRRGMPGKCQGDKELC